MNYPNAQNDFCKRRYGEHDDDASWPAIVALIFDVIAHRDRLALKRKALGRHRRKLARRIRNYGGSR